MHHKTIAVFGGTGFLGRYVVKQLADAGYRVRVFSRKPLKAYHLQPLGKPGQISLEYGDITNSDSLIGSMDNCYGVVNLVGIRFESGKRSFSAVHAQGAERVAQRASIAGVKRMVHVSALAVDRADRSSYARSKYAGEKAVLAAMPSATILRPSVIFGAEDDFFNTFASMARISPALPVFGTGRTEFQPVFANDVAKAVVASLQNEDAFGKTFELGGPDVLRFKQLLEYVLSCVGKKRCLVKIPYSIASIMGGFASFLPKPPFTRDQVTLLKYSNTVGEDALGFADLGIVPTPMDTVVPAYLKCHTAKG